MARYDANGEPIVERPRPRPRQMRPIEDRLQDPNPGVARQAREQSRSGARYDVNGAPITPVPHDLGETIEDFGRSMATGTRRFGAAMAGLPGEIQRVNEAGSRWAAGELERGMGGTPEDVERSRASIPESFLPNTEQVTEFFDQHPQVFGREHTPETTAGEYGRTIGEFGSAVLAPGGIATRITRAVVPAVASEAAGQAFEGTDLEFPARVVGGLGAGLATEMSVAANARRALARSADPESAALEQEFGPLTQGERSRHPRARLEEDDLRRGIGSDQAQRTIQAFDDRRAPEVRRNVMNIATRGQEGVSEDLGAAGTTVADSLRSRVDNMRDQQRRLYQEAFDLAESERVSANQVANELTDRVDAIANQEFLDAGPARVIIGRLQGEISAGQATYGTAERARQALNRLLGSALKSQDDATAYAITRVIDELDAFVAPRLSAEASRAVTEARGFTREMLNSFGQRQRTELSTGHVGRSDPGGRAIERVLNNDLTGEQVVDAILGAGTKPSQQTLGAVRRIREINDSIVYTNRNAASGVRVPGRTKVGGQTQGERRFAADSPDARYGVELPNPELQGLREALFYRLLRPLDVRNEGGVIPAQTVVSNLRRALDGPGAEITSTLFTPRETAAMRRALAYFERLIPPAGSAVSGTAPALSRMVHDGFNKLISLIPGIGPVVRETIENATSTNVARRAVRPPPPRGAPRTEPIEQPTLTGPLAVGALSAQSARERERR